MQRPAIRLAPAAGFALFASLALTPSARADEHAPVASTRPSPQAPEITPLRFSLDPAPTDTPDTPDTPADSFRSLAAFKLSLPENLAGADQPEPPPTHDLADDDAAQPDSADEGSVADAEPAHDFIPFGLAGSQWLSFGGAYSNDFDEAQDFSVTVAYSNFLADRLEFMVEGAAYYFNQPGDDTGGFTADMMFRWHLFHDNPPEGAGYDWTIFAEAGIGLLFAFDNVPANGTGFDFNPRAGAGFTKALDDAGTRLVLGVRWNHFSNGRIEGDHRNPGRDSLMVYAGVQVPF